MKNHVIIGYPMCFTYEICVIELFAVFNFVTDTFYNHDGSRWSVIVIFHAQFSFLRIRILFLYQMLHKSKIRLSCHNWDSKKTLTPWRCLLIFIPWECTTGVGSPLPTHCGTLVSIELTYGVKRMDRGDEMRVGNGQIEASWFLDRG